MDINYKEVTVNIGGLFYTKEPTIITTILGSCVSVTMFDSVIKAGGLNHIVLPGTFVENDYERMLEEKDSRYGIFSLEKLLYGLESLGAKRENIEANIFGASLINREEKSVLKIQESNVEFVKAFLSMARIKVINEVILQKEPLKIYFNTFNGTYKVIKLAQNRE